MIHNEFEEKYILDEIDVLVARALLKVFDEQKDFEKVVTTYEHISDLINRKKEPVELRTHLGKISELCYDILGLPFISAIVVSQKDAKPGKGFYDKVLIVRGYDTEEKQKEIIEKARTRKDWSLLEEHLDKYYGKN